MNITPVEHAESMRIGTVEYVSPDNIKVSLDIDAPHALALNAGSPRPFPRINSYLIIPGDEGYLVGQVEWITVEHSDYPKRRGMRDFGLVDLPFPLRKMNLNPLGTLKREIKDKYVFKRGADAFPSVGDSVLLPTGQQLRSIVESGENRRIKIGTCPLAGSADVCVDPDRLFGRHLAVLGNTGSGKSCSVAGMIRWSLEAAKAITEKDKVNAHFIILDPNGEYQSAFGNSGDLLKARVFKVEPEGIDEAPLHVPLWFWNSAEWSSFTQASGKTQRPLLRRALRDIKTGRTGLAGEPEEEMKLRLRMYLISNLISIRKALSSGSIRSQAGNFGTRLTVIKDDLEFRRIDMARYGHHIDTIIEKITDALNDSFGSFVKNGNKVEYFKPFKERYIEAIIEKILDLITELGGMLLFDGPSEDVPVEFDGTDFADHLRILSEENNAAQFLDFLIMRIRTILSDNRMKSIINSDTKVFLNEWLDLFIGNFDSQNENISIIDLSLVPSEIVHITIAVIARMVFEALQRYRKLDPQKQVLPTVLVMEEAHTFIRRYKEDAENQDAAAVCCQVFERIAREGRKFGLGLLLSSQRPSELSPTVLSQCNTFLLHRITNDRDQDLVNRLVPDSLRGLMRELPSLASQNAILLGWAAELPVLVRMNDLSDTHRPKSDDPDFWDVWTGNKERPVDWKRIADDWQGLNSLVKPDAEDSEALTEASESDAGTDDIPF